MAYDSSASALTGVWDGTSVAGCLPFMPDLGRCHAEQKIEFQMLQHGDSVSGYYQCSYGTQICRNLDESGVIRDASIVGRMLRMRVMNEDGSMCFFTGWRYGAAMKGDYSCLQGAGIVESGAFQTHRIY